LSGEGLWRLDTQNLIQDGLTRWDSGWYIGIVQNGYSSKSVAFFPLYPILMRMLNRITGSSSISGLLIANLSFFLALFYLYAITKQDYDDKLWQCRILYCSAQRLFFLNCLYRKPFLYL
jgi:Gpi18-like mannosyltransferase